MLWCDLTGRSGKGRDRRLLCGAVFRRCVASWRGGSPPDHVDLMRSGQTVVCLVRYHDDVWLACRDAQRVGEQPEDEAKGWGGSTMQRIGCGLAVLCLAALAAGISPVARHTRPSHLGRRQRDALMQRRASRVVPRLCGRAARQ